MFIYQACVSFPKSTSAIVMRDVCSMRQTVAIKCDGVDFFKLKLRKKKFVRGKKKKGQAEAVQLQNNKAVNFCLVH